jgi:hypothetical protein
MKEAPPFTFHIGQAQKQGTTKLTNTSFLRCCFRYRQTKKTTYKRMDKAILSYAMELLHSTKRLACMRKSTYVTNLVLKGHVETSSSELLQFRCRRSDGSSLGNIGRITHKWRLKRYVSTWNTIRHRQRADTGSDEPGF